MRRRVLVRGARGAIGGIYELELCWGNQKSLLLKVEATRGWRNTRLAHLMELAADFIKARGEIGASRLRTNSGLSSARCDGRGCFSAC